MKKRRLFSIMAASVLAVSLLAGCGGKSATADGQTDKAEAQAQSGQSSEKKVLRVWLEKVFSDDANTFLQKRVEQYAQEKGVEMCIRDRNIGETVTVMGWVQKSRNKGGIIFVDLRDRSGILQIIFEESDCGAGSFAKAERLRSEFVVAVTGKRCV